MRMFEVIFIDFQTRIVFGESIADIRTKYPTAIFISEVTIH
jgi:hypothetical protein